MPKIFSNISYVDGLKKVYSSSSLNEVESPFNFVRELAIPGGPTDIGLVSNDIRRIEPIYDLFTNATKSSLTFDKNKLRVSATVRKINRTANSTLYDRFSTNNPYLINETQVLPENGTLLEIKPYSKDVADRSTMLQDSQSLPLVSGPRDEKRLFNYLKSSEGIRFLAKQQILQAGNTFKQSRRYNPASVLLATSKYALANLANPLERVDRALSLNSQSTSKTIPQMIEMSELAGRVQQETVLSKQDQLRIRFVGGQTNGSNRRTAIGQILSTGINRVRQSLLNRTNISLFGRRINLGQLGRTLNSVSQVADAILRATDIDNSTIKKDQTAYDALIQKDLWPLVRDKDGTVQNFHINKKNYITRAQKSMELLKLRGKLHTNFFTKPYPDIENDYRSSESYTDDVQTDVGTINGVVSAKYMKDPMNMSPRDKPLANLRDIDGAYESTDFIKFKIVVPNVFNEGLNFRAFIQDLKHDAKGEYEEQRYVGRPERFMVYKGMSRTLKFTAYLVAFTKDELTGVWLRANMLNKLVYPVNTAAGYMVPPIARLTIGNVIEDQPGYFTDVSMDFDNCPWDIDSEVSKVVKLELGFNIIEKNFITQNQTNNSLFSADPFANDLIAKRVIYQTTDDYVIPNIEIPEINLNPRVDPLSQESLSRDFAATTQRFVEKKNQELGLQNLLEFARNGSVGRG